MAVRKFICQASNVAYNSSWLVVTGGYLLLVHVRVLHFARFVHLHVILLSTKQLESRLLDILCKKLLVRLIYASAPKFYLK